MAIVRIRLVGETDASVGAMFRGVEAVAKRSRATVSGETARSQRESVASANRVAREQEKLIRQTARSRERALADQTRVEERAAREQVKLVERAAKEKDRTLARIAKRQDQLGAERARTYMRNVEQETRAEQRAAERSRRVFIDSSKNVGGSIVQGIGNTAAKLGRVGVGALGTIGRGMGVDLDPSSVIAKNASLQSAVVDVANTNAMANNRSANANDIATIRGSLEGAATNTKTDVNALAQALQVFTAKTGNMDEGIANLEMFAQLARATGSDVTELAGAAGEISKGLGNAPDKAKIMAESLRLVAKQGAMGSVEIKDLAAHMGKFASKAFQFTGPRERSIGEMGALAQMAMLGGAASPVEAASSAGNFGRDVMKNSKEFDKAGIQLFTTENGMKKLRRAEDIIVESLVKTGGDPQKLQELFTNQSSRKAALGFAGLFSEAGGGASGVKAVRDKFKALSQSVSQKDVQSAFQLSAGTDEAKATALNNSIQLKTAEVMSRLLPELEKALPALGQLATTAAGAAPALAQAGAGALKFGASMVQTVTNSDNLPFTIAAGLTAALGKAIGGSGGFVLQAAAVTLVAGMTAVDQHFEQKRKNETSDVEKSAEVSNLLSSKNPADAGKLIEMQRYMTERLARARELQAGYEKSGGLAALAFEEKYGKNATYTAERDVEAMNKRTMGQQASLTPMENDFSVPAELMRINEKVQGINLGAAAILGGASGAAGQGADPGAAAAQQQQQAATALQGSAEALQGAANALNGAAGSMGAAGGNMPSVDAGARG